MYIEYRHNNSGGKIWLKDEDWKNLEEAGWIVQWVWMQPSKDRKDCGTPILIFNKDLPKEKIYSWNKTTIGEKDMGTLAWTAYRPNLTLMQAVEEWESVTNKCATDAGCPCCGPPHNFTEYDSDGSYIKDGPDISYTSSFSW